MGRKRITVTKEENGKNINFQDNYTNKKYTKKQFVRAIKNNKDNLADKYHIRTIKGEEIPVSNPDKDKSNNLG